MLVIVSIATKVYYLVNLCVSVEVTQLTLTNLVVLYLLIKQTMIIALTFPYISYI